MTDRGKRHGEVVASIAQALGRDTAPSEATAIWSWRWRQELKAMTWIRETGKCLEVSRQLTAQTISRALIAGAQRALLAAGYTEQEAEDLVGIFAEQMP
jgi:tyrosyl-tRNA synthetase